MAKYKVTTDDGKSYLVTTEDGQDQSGFGQTVKNSVIDMFKKPAMVAKDVGTNPQTMANLMPSLLGTAGGVSPVPGGATLGTAAGQGIRDLALKGLGKPAPGMMQHGLELGGAAAGDVMAIPYMKGKVYGGQIGNAEKAAGVITRAPTKAVTPGSVGETLNNLEAQLDAGTIKTAQEAKDAKAVINQIYKNPRIYEQTSDIKVQAARVAKKTQDLLNKSIPGRLDPSQALAKSQVIPNLIKKNYMAMPWAVRHGAEGAASAGLVWEVIKKILGQ